MKQEAFRHFTDTHLSMIGMGLFLVSFAIVTWWAYRLVTKNQVDHWSRLPLDEQKENHL